MRVPSKVLSASASLAALVLGAHLARAGDAKTVIAAAAAAGKFKTFFKLVAAADYVKTLEGPGPFTIFAPTDAAFAKVKKVDLDNLMKDKVKLTRFVLHHVYQGKKAFKDIKSGKIKTLRGLELCFFEKNGDPYVNESKIIQPDINAGNGIVHGLDRPLDDIEHLPEPPGPQGENKVPADPDKTPPAKGDEKAPEAPKEDAGVDSLHALSATSLDGKDTALSDWKGKVVLIVNVASECGYTPQYTGLQKLHAELAEKGFAVLGFPSNEFGGQEPGDSAAIKKFCEGRYKVTFPMFEKVVTKPGASQSPVYSFLTKGREAPNWNFCKYLVGKDGKVVKFWKSATKPEDPELRAAIDAALK